MVYRVAPRVGAWIETLGPNGQVGTIKSHPVWVRGLKHRNSPEDETTHRVAPRVGAWIETK